ncbi:transporter substrate-binding domain-containing protein [Leeia sp. TBRC 13508]|uniref:Transporter substrate-binding domain-containing protein n=1 Tax=Leeia speluncae TaxID=2884804 RepID=A0ABS8D713_9NEIS|nr:transporter substrate-binding domain-containing protein [Leeia speluncae]MCB6183990.1 transporter substrate-binding domain-containing protein [Leeia speluncae]
MKRIFLLFCLTAMLFPWLVQAQGKKIVLCGTHWPPYSYASGDQFVKGISIELYHAIFNELGYEVTLKALPWQRCLEWAKEGRVDGVMDNASVKGLINGETPTAAYPIGMYVLERSPYQVFSWEQMKGKVVGLVKGYDYPMPIMRFQGWDKDYGVDDTQVVSKLGAGRYEFALLDMFSGPEIAKQQGLHIRMLTPGVASEPLYLTFNAKQTALMHHFDHALKQYIASGKLDQIYKKYTKWKYREVINLGKLTEQNQMRTEINLQPNK